VGNQKLFKKIYTASEPKSPKLRGLQSDEDDQKEGVRGSKLWKLNLGEDPQKIKENRAGAPVRSGGSIGWTQTLITDLYIKEH